MPKLAILFWRAIENLNLFRRLRWRGWLALDEIVVYECTYDLGLGGIGREEIVCGCGWVRG